ncbi:1-acylglycerol-3-phosphate O [Hysterangium stoloniferum]|nr:1-acylglycerol-3-phosphate O [Hysterangium stoloniferum]
MSFLQSVTYVSLPLLVLHSVSSRSSVGRYYIRLAIYLSTLSLCSVFGAVASVGAILAGRRYKSNQITARTFYAIAGPALGISFDVEGEHWLQTTCPAVLIGNHQSMLDILYLGRIFPDRASMVAKKELQWVPFLGQYLTASGAIFLDRSNNVNAVKSLAAAGDAMKNRRISLWLFPEGTRTLRSENKLLPFKKGAFHLAVQAGVPIVPVVCENYSRLYGSSKFESGRLRIRVLEPIPTVNLTPADISDLAIRTHRLMEDTLQEISTHDSNDVQPSHEETTKPTATEPGPANEPTSSADNVEIMASARTSSSTSLGHQSSEVGAETESDEGMVFVDRPT